jgi:hypothetical protein
MHVDVRHKERRIRQYVWRKCEEKVARRDVTKWASHSCWRDNPAKCAKIIVREFWHILRGGVNKGTKGMSPALFSICCLVVLILAVNFSFSADQDFNDKNWDDFDKIPQSLPEASQKEYKPLPIPTQNEPAILPMQNPEKQLEDMRFKDKYGFPNQNIVLDQRSLKMIDQQAQDGAVLANQKRWRQMMESNKANLFRKFDEWLEVFHIPKEYHLLIELLLVALFIIFFGIIFYRRGLRKRYQDDFAAYKEHKYNHNASS